MDDVGGFVVAVWAGLPEVGDRDHHQRRIYGGDCVVVKTERGHDARVEILDKDIRFDQELLEEGSSGGGLQVERNALLASVQVGEQQAAFGVRLVFRERRQTAGGITAGPLDLDDVRAEVGEELGAVRARDVVGKVEDARAL